MIAMTCSHHIRRFLLLGFVLLLAACSGKKPAADSPIPTFSPTPATLAPAQLITPPPTFTPTPSPQPPTPTYTPSPQEIARQRVADLGQRLDEAIAARDEAQIALLDETLKGLAEAEPEQVAMLHSRARFALDVANGCYYLRQLPHRRLNLITSQGEQLQYPIAFTVANDKIFFIDSGNLYGGDLSMLSADAQALTVEKILDRSESINGYPIKELMDVIMTEEGALFALDKSNDLYVSHDLGQSWEFEYLSARDFDAPAPLFKNMATYVGRIYLLDPARNQIWRHPPNDFGDSYLPGILPWRLHPGDVDISDGVDLTVDGTIFVLNRDGSILRLNPTLMAEYDIKQRDDSCHAPGWQALPVRPISIWTEVESGPLYVADMGKRRILLVDRDTGNVLSQILAPEDINFASLRGAMTYRNEIVAMAGPHLYLIPIPDQSTQWQGELPDVRNWREEDLSGHSPASLSPQAPRIPFILRQNYHFIMSIDGAKLPDRDPVYPGARRAYRYGVHQGMDLFASDVGADIQVGTPVRVAAEGVVIRADLNYHEMTYAEITALLDDANARHFTPPDTLDKLGGRQVWVDHGDSVITKYLHLSAIAPGIEVGKQVQQGEIIGKVGLSGTPDGILGRNQYAHLHFEIRLGPEHGYYFGQWLTTEQARYAFRDLYPDIPIYPAFSTPTPAPPPTPTPTQTPTPAL